ncbi:MAG: hypothetical protein SNJ64_05965 [Endomicrobiia bacterium]
MCIGNGNAQNAGVIGLGNSKMADLSVVSVDTHILLKAFRTISEFLGVLKRNFLNILFWEFLFIGSQV